MPGLGQRPVDPRGGDFERVRRLTEIRYSVEDIGDIATERRQGIEIDALVTVDHDLYGTVFAGRDDGDVLEVEPPGLDEIGEECDDPLLGRNRHRGGNSSLKLCESRRVVNVQLNAICGH